MVWLILRLMLGSLYAIVYGAVNLTVPLPPMSLVTFDAPAFLLGVAILLGAGAAARENGGRTRGRKGADRA